MYRQTHLKEVRAYAKDWSQRNPDKVKAFKLKAKYRITMVDYQSLMGEQFGVCAICGEKEANTEYLAVDHDHITGEVRGLLCKRCNKGLGFFLDKPDLLVKAIVYLKKHGIH